MARLYIAQVLLSSEFFFSCIDQQPTRRLMMPTYSEREPSLEVIPLGGLGEFGMNTMAVSSNGTTILIDAGVMFSSMNHFGVDLIVPDLDHLRTSERRLAALFLTHGHEDHIGGVPYAWDLLDGPVYATTLTLGLLKPKLAEHGIDAEGKLIPIEPGQSVTLGSLEVEFLRVTHSLPDSAALAIHTVAGTIVHTGDYKIDTAHQDEQPMDLERFEGLGQAGVLALFGDSTNIDRQGVTGSESDVIPAFEDILSTTVGKLVVSTFASSLHRVQLLLNLAARFNRKVVLVGRSIKQNTKIAAELNRLSIPSNLIVSEADISNLPPEQILCLATGSQGERFSALSRISLDQHPTIKLSPGDVVVFSARSIPGNQRAIAVVMDNIARRGADIVGEDDKTIHVSGHGSADELRLMLSLTKPKYFIPIHGEYRYMDRHARAAKLATNGATEVFLLENGDRLCFDTTGAWLGQAVPSGRILIDQTRTGKVVDRVLRNRRRLARNGMIVLVISIDKETRQAIGEPTLLTRGFVDDTSLTTLKEEMFHLVCAFFKKVDAPHGTDQLTIQEALKIELQQLCRRTTGLSPMLLPVVVEI
jgi:ribonuclease J